MFTSAITVSPTPPVTLTTRTDLECILSISSSYGEYWRLITYRLLYTYNNLGTFRSHFALPPTSCLNHPGPFTTSIN
jgi:hypothetical protein